MFCEVPEGAPHAGEVVPFFYVHWMRHFNCWRDMQVSDGVVGSMKIK